MKTDLDTFAREIERLRGNLLFGETLNVDAEEQPKLTGASEQYFLLAIASLEQAERFMKLAHIATVAP